MSHNVIKRHLAFIRLLFNTFFFFQDLPSLMHCNSSFLLKRNVFHTCNLDGDNTGGYFLFLYNELLDQAAYYLITDKMSKMPS